MSPTLRLFEDPQEMPEDQRMFWDSVDLEAALQLWRKESCEEFTGGKHPFELTVEEGSASVACAVCRHNPLDEGDLNEYLSFGPIPVEVKVRGIVYPGGPWGSTEYDVEVEVTLK
jgi:hypothetical protein